jgi:phosphoacetylglucosamine mutase
LIDFCLSVIVAYFEANGHGTVVFGRKFYCLLAQAEQDLLDESYEHDSTWSRSLVAWQRLRILPRLINQAVGDALSDLLLVDAILSLKDFTLEHWDSLYQDLPSRQLKIRVADRKYVETNEDETKVTSPLSLQLAIDETLSSFQHENSVPVRAFVRPSGTEDVVRVYAEASTQKDADNLAFQVSLLVYDLCNGAGERPVLFLS